MIVNSAAAAAKSLQSCPILCDPIDGSPSGSPSLGFSRPRILDWVAISFSNAWKWKVKVKSLSCPRLLATPWIAAYQAPPSMGFSWQESWSGVPSPSLTVFLGGSQITANDDCSHEIKRYFLLGRKAMTNLNSILKSRDITLPAKVCLVVAMVFPVVTFGCESWSIKKAEHRRIDDFELRCWRRLLKVTWISRRLTSQS